MRTPIPNPSLTSAGLTSIVLTSTKLSASSAGSTGEGGNLIGTKNINSISKQHPPPLEGLGEAFGGGLWGSLLLT